MQTHILKIDRVYVDPIVNREKAFEVRKNDRGFQKGDKIQFKVINDYSSLSTMAEYSSFETRKQIEETEYLITYVLNSFEGLKEGYVVLGIAPIQF